MLTLLATFGFGLLCLVLGWRRGYAEGRAEMRYIAEHWKSLYEAVASGVKPKGEQ